MVGILGLNPRAERFLPYLDSNLDDYTPGAEEYSAFIVDQILPFVEGKYNINSSKRAIFGISFGGIHATWIGIRYPGVFSFIGALSPSYWVANEAIFKESVSGLVQSGPSIPHRFYFDRGTGEWSDIVPFIAHLKSADLEYATNIFYYEVVGAKHETEYWALRIQVPFRLFMEGNPESEIRGLEIQSYCIPDAPNPALPKLNPIISYKNGVIMSVMTEATYEITAGSGNVRQDGSYTVSSGTSMTVKVSYKGFSKSIVLSSCE
jgi:pimeloyl-ACP methyl ester carboxylesterase